jgi:hypothetical protein
MSDLFSSIFDTLRDTFQQVANADFPFLVVLAVAVVLVGILIFRR